MRRECKPILLSICSMHVCCVGLHLTMSALFFLFSCRSILSIHPSCRSILSIHHQATLEVWDGLAHGMHTCLLSTCSCFSWSFSFSSLKSDLFFLKISFLFFSIAISATFHHRRISEFHGQCTNCQRNCHDDWESVFRHRILLTCVMSFKCDCLLLARESDSVFIQKENKEFF